jgi:hypothetical protein
VHTSPPNDGSDRRLGIGDQVDNHPTQRAQPPAERSRATSRRPAPTSASRIGTERAKTWRSHDV